MVWVRVDVWGVDPRSVSSALALVGPRFRSARGVPGQIFARALGTGHGNTFTFSDADWTHWAVITCWADGPDRSRWEASPYWSRWSQVSREHASIDARPLSSVGQWSRRSPFPAVDVSTATQLQDVDPRTLAITRGRIKPRYWKTFAQSTRPIADDLHSVEGLLFRRGIGEAPIGMQGTLSLWESSAAMRAFVSSSPHRAAIARTRELRWYSEDLFATLAVTGAQGRCGATTFSDSP